MIRRFLFAVSLIVAIQGQHALAHPGGHGPIDEAAAIGFGHYIAGQLAEIDAGLGFGQLAASWRALPPGASRVFIKGEGFYIIAIENSEESRTLYILMTDTGEVYDANFTGEFEGLK